MKILAIMMTLALMIVCILYWQDHSKLVTANMQSSTKNAEYASQLWSQKTKLAVDDAQECEVINALNDEIEKVKSGAFSRDALVTSDKLPILVDSKDCLSHAGKF